MRSNQKVKVKVFGFIIKVQADVCSDKLKPVLKALTVNVLLQDQGDQGGRRDQGVRVCHLFHLGQEDPVRKGDGTLNEYFILSFWKLGLLLSHKNI